MPQKSAHDVYVSRNNCNLNQRLKYKFSMMQSSAIRRGVSFTLTFEDVLEMWRNQKGLCGLTSRRMFLTVGRGLFYRNCQMSIDRLDPQGSYTKDNVILCRFDANRQKSRRSLFSADYMELYPEQVARVLQFKPQLHQLAA